MSIRIVRNEQGNCINFYGSSNPTYWNACLSGQVDASKPDKINIINDIITAQTGIVEYEFYRIPYTEFTDAEGNSFATAQETADYITEKANVTGLSGEGIDLIGQTVCFSLDDTSTSIILDNGYHFGVNTIKAVPDADGTIHIISIDDSNSITHFYNLEVGNVCINNDVIQGGLNDVANVLNELFSVGPFESVVISDPYSTMVANVSGVDIISPTYIGNAIDPVGADVFGTSATGSLNGYLSTEVIDQSGEYFTFDIRVEGIIGMGLVHTQASYDDGKYSGSATYADPTTFGTSNSQHYGFQFSHWFHPTPNGPWTNYGANTSYVQGPGWNNANLKFNASPEGADWLAGNPVKMRVGLDTSGFISIEYYDQSESTWIVCARTSYASVEGVEYRLGIKMGDTNVRLNTLPKIHELAVTVNPPTALGDQSITVFEDNAGDINGTLAGGITSDVSVTNSNDGFVSTESISSIGDYFQFEWSAGDANVGLFSEQDHDVADLQADRTYWPNDRFIYFGARTENNLTLNNIYYENGNHTTLAPTGGSGYGRVGFDEQGRAKLWYSSDGVTWTAYKVHNQSAPVGTYKFIWVAQNENVANLDSLTKGTMDFAPIMNFRYIESPDGYYSYPLFATQEEADYYELIVSGVDNGSHAHVYVDDPTMSTWYMPNTAHQMNYELTPIEDGITTFNGNTINWTEITSLTNADLVPPTFSLSDQILSENEAVNLQVTPQDASWTTTVTGLPEGLTFNGNDLITGNTSYVSSDQTTEVTVTRTNSYGSSVGIFNIVIQDDASIGDLTGYNETAGNYVQPNRIHLSEDALLQYDTVLSQGQQITYSYSAGSIPPTIGILSSAGEANLSSFDPSTDTLGTVNGVNGNNFAETLNWDLRYVTFGGDIGSTTEKFNLVGWADNTVQAGSEGTNYDVEFKLEYKSDGYIRLYRDNVLKLTSSSTFTGDQTITLAAFDDQAQTDVYIPSNWTVSTIGAGTTTPPSGFVDPLLEGQMASTVLLDTDSATQLTDTLEIGMRYIFPKAWIQDHVLPYCDELNNEVFIGVPSSAADYSDVGETDFDALFRIKGNGDDTHVSDIKTASTAYNNMTINSMTNAFYDYAIEWDGTDLHIIACNINDINAQPAVSLGGQFGRVVTESNYSGTSTLNIVIATDNGGQVNLTTAGLQKIRIPFGTHDVLVGENSAGIGQFALQPVASSFDDPGQHASNNLSYDGLTTLIAGDTYRFIYDPSLEANDYIEFRLASDGTTVYNPVGAITTFDGTSDGDPKVGEKYKGLTFTVPTDAPPLQLWYYNGFSSSYDNGAARPISVSGSTYVASVTGITLEGPVGNQTGTNLFNDPAVDADGVVWGWLSIDEQLSAGERLVLDNAFMVDLTDAMPDNSAVFIGLKSGTWTNNYRNNSIANATYAGARFAIYRYSAADIRVFGYITGATTIGRNFGTNQIDTANLELAFDITNSGNNIRLMMGSSNNSSDDVNSTAYADWDSSYKTQTGDQGYGLTSVDVMILGDANVTGSGGSAASSEMDSANVDWTLLSEISVPSPAPTNETPWTKALDFSGSSERAVQISQNTTYNTLRMNGLSATALGNASANYTSSDGVARPWATAIVFSADLNSSNQHIWNSGEGAGSTDDNIYLRLAADYRLYFGWGRSGALNELYLGTLNPNIGWYGCYIASTGERLSGANATPSNLADCFDVRLLHSGNNFTMSTYNWSNDGVGTGWNSSFSTTGGRMDRAITGDFTVGGRGANRNFHGKVASMVITTLKLNVPMPTDAEIHLMITDPKKWEDDYLVGNTIRQAHYTTNATYLPSNIYNGFGAIQIWLMGDGDLDSYSNMIRNQVYPSDQNYTKLNLVSMVSNDIQNVTIPGLS